MLIDIRSKTEGETYYLSTSNQIIFISLVRPTETLSFHIAVQNRTDEFIKWSAKYYKDDTIYFKMKGIYKKQL
ncbi:MAG: hypothetical protein ACI94Y_001039 [Maribacter sp.]|jgi:hypothetical protein